MRIAIYQIDAFTDQLFKGNPAAICPLTRWLPDETLQAIAAENNLSETAFFVPLTGNNLNNEYQLRWFTPTKEVNLCGHATLAAAFVLFEILAIATHNIIFHTKSGELVVEKLTEKPLFNEENTSSFNESLQVYYQLDFPSQPPNAIQPFDILTTAFSEPVEACFAAEDYLVKFADNTDIEKVKVNIQMLKELDRRGVIIFAHQSCRNRMSDDTNTTALPYYHARFFAPNYGIDEDPVTGSAYTQLAPLWAKETGNTEFLVTQKSARTGQIIIKYNQDRVILIGQAVEYLRGEIRVC